MRHRAEVATRKKQYFHEVLAILVFSFKKTPPTTALYCYNFQPHWEGIEAQGLHLQCSPETDCKANPCGAPGSSGTEGLREMMERQEAAPLPCLWGPHQHGRVSMACRGVGRSQNIPRLWDIFFFPSFFLRCMGVYVKGRGKIPAALPLHLPRGCSVLTLPGPHMWADLSACVGGKMSHAGPEAKLLEVNESISIDLKDFGLDSLSSTNGRAIWKSQESQLLFFGPTALGPICFVSLTASPAKPTAAQDPLCTTLLLLSSAEI